MSNTSIFLVARILGISSSIFLSGFAFSASYLGSPAISLSPVPLRLQQWQVIYDLGKLVTPTVAAASTLLWGFSAWIARGSEDWKSYAVGGLATFLVLPWTLLVIRPVNLELMKRAKVAKEGSEGLEFEKKSEEFLTRWDSMNFVRAALPMVGAWVGLYAALK